jgi:hypothetical protein
MISPHTPPGTPLIVVKLFSAEEAAFLLRPQFRWMVFGQRPSPFHLGQRVTLARIAPHFMVLRGFAAQIAGDEKAWWALETFDVATLPSCITDCLVGKPVDDEVLLPCDC